MSECGFKLAFSDEDEGCPSNVGDSWWYVGQGWQHKAGEGLSLSCIEGNGNLIKIDYICSLLISFVELYQNAEDFTQIQVESSPRPHTWMHIPNLHSVSTSSLSHSDHTLIYLSSWWTLIANTPLRIMYWFCQWRTPIQKESHIGIESNGSLTCDF